MIDKEKLKDKRDKEKEESIDLWSSYIDDKNNKKEEKDKKDNKK